MAIVYQHKRKDTGEVFYVGIGKEESRAYEYGRNHLWQEVVDETEYDIEITHRDIIYEEACSIEKYLIAFWGRKNLRLGPLTNLTDGGDTTEGYKHTQDSKKKISNSLIGFRHSKQSIEKIADSHRDVPLSIYHRYRISIGNLNKPKSKEHRKSLALSKLGVKHKIVFCPHCNKSGGISNMHRYHFENCKYIKKNT
jgi:hypothetical protein